MNYFSKSKEFLSDILFPKFCVNCRKEGNYICEDCFSLIEIFDRRYCPFCNKTAIDFKTCPSCKKFKSLDGLFCAASYEDFIVKKLIHQFKYEPFVKDLSKTLSNLIIAYFKNLNMDIDFNTFLLVPVPLHKRKIKHRGFNQSEELAKELSKNFEIPVLTNTLIKTKNTSSQTDLKKEERIENIKNAFIVSLPKLVENRKILLLDDVFTTGSTMEECSKVLKKSGAEEVWGVVAARG